MPSNLGSLILLNSKRTLKDCVKLVDGFKITSVHYQDTNSLYIEKSHCDTLTKKFVKEQLGQRRMIEVTELCFML